MPQYVFRIRQGTHSSDVPVDLADHDAAWHEGAKVCSDLIRDVVARLRDSPEWRSEVSDETGEPLHLFRLTAEASKKNSVRLSWRPLLFAQALFRVFPWWNRISGTEDQRHYNNNRPPKFPEAISLRSVNDFLEI